MALPPIVVAAGFVIAAGCAIAAMAYMAWKGSKQSDFFVDAVRSTYDLPLAVNDIDTYYDLKDRLQKQCLAVVNPSGECPEDGREIPWVPALNPEDKHNLKIALMRRLVSAVDRLDKVKRDKPGNWKLWRGKLVSEQYWTSLCECEKRVGEEIDSCLWESAELEPGWEKHIFPQAVQHWQALKARDMEKKVEKKVVQQQKKQKEKEARSIEVEARLKEEAKVREERRAEKAMEKLLAEEEKQAKSKGKAKAAPSSGKATKKK
eukprot:gnl/TRDRNA2_/TRDRNA2_184765_c0_seq1.p1 gnl/TRDRNA2_/TRDRNA2_184765_c0~~gnl/TRDRNA2_/TRDRNA2_184765_c0_seq1.p1  ORF type:complete len:262 (+),score=68.04 gnl/TRDRNA2_/TRDRNA2_184765_c0_seq1:153-938(+)